MDDNLFILKSAAILRGLGGEKAVKSLYEEVLEDGLESFKHRIISEFMKKESTIEEVNKIKYRRGEDEVKSVYVFYESKFIGYMHIELSIKGFTLNFDPV